MGALLKKFGKLLLVVIVFTGSYQWWKPTPDFLLVADRTYLVPERGVTFYADTTFVDGEGKRQMQQQIWDRVFTLIDNAEHYILADVFLFNNFQGKTPETHRALSGELAQKLIESRAANPHIAITLVTDPINTVYEGVVTPSMDALRKAGIAIVETNLIPLRDSNLLWSSIWRPFFSWFGNSTEGGWLPHPFQADGPKVSLRSWAALLNFKANHRKIIVADQPDGKMVTFVTSANPHDGSSAHGNVALEVDDSIWKSVTESENLVARLRDGGVVNYDAGKIKDETGLITVQLLREQAIKTKVLETLKGARRGDSFQLAMFYLSDRTIINSLIDAANSGADIRVILDPNRDAFGFEKNGIPNRPVAKELVRRSGGDIKIRWCDTHGEQCHAKLFMGTTATSSFMIVGSANFTRRNLDNHNLEASIIASAPEQFSARTDALAYFNNIWENKGGTFTVEYGNYEDTTWWKSPIYRMQERSGISSF